jgi:hypothetical protein
VREGHKDEKHEEKSIIQGKYPKYSPHPKFRKVVRCSLGVTKNAGNQEARQNKEQIYSTPTDVEELRENAIEGSGLNRLLNMVGSEVIDDYKQDCDTSHSIENWNMTAKVRPRRRHFARELH